MGHTLLIVTTEIRERTSLEARQRVFDYLCEYLFFREDGSDYFSIGGAWSGYLLGLDKTSDEELGEDYDAQILSQSLYLQFLTPHRGRSVYHGETLMYIDLEDELCFSLFIGRKWIVAVDMHY